VKRWPAIDVRSDSPDLVLAAVDDFSPTAAEEQDDRLRLFFATPTDRDAARHALDARGYSARSIEVDDEDWARRSQGQLRPVRVGRLLIATSASAPKEPAPEEILVVIEPSMGFGTGHHATTRLCLAGLQALNLRGKTVLDVGTGSGILAIAAAKLGAARAIGIDSDPDAIQAADENLVLNPGPWHLRFEVADLMAAGLEPADVVTANLTGALLVRSAGLLARAVVPGGVLILSGILAPEEDAVLRAFAGFMLRSRDQEEEWVGLVLTDRPRETAAR
jgi:ribosomal protein L11 methyltransferase